MRPFNIFMIKCDFEYRGYTPSPNDNDLNYKSIIQRVINVNCDYDGDKTEGLVPIFAPAIF
jgi:hypothetical protein